MARKSRESELSFTSFLFKTKVGRVILLATAICSATLGYSFLRVVDSGKCLDGDQQTKPECSLPISASQLPLSIIRNLAGDANPLVRKDLETVLNTTDGLVAQNLLRARQFNDPDSLAGLSVIYTNGNGERTYEVVVPSASVYPADAYGTDIHELTHISRARQRELSHTTTWDRKGEEVEADMIGNYVAQLAIDRRIAGRSSEVEKSKGGIDLRRSAKALIDAGFGLKSKVYECLYKNSIWYIWNGRQDILDLFSVIFFRSDDQKREFANTEANCRDVSNFAPRGTKERVVIDQLINAGVTAPNFFASK